MLIFFYHSITRNVVNLLGLKEVIVKKIKKEL